MEELKEISLPPEGSEEEAALLPEGERGAEDWPGSWQEEEEAPGPEEEKGSVSLRYLGQERQVGPEELKELAQKGLDYSRIRGQRDSLLPKMRQLEELTESLAESMGLSSEELQRRFAAERKLSEAQSRGEKLSYEEAYARGSAELPGGREELRQQELLSFARSHPELGPEDIDPEVWQGFLDGRELEGLYAQSENRRLRAQLRELRQQQENSFRSTGSLHSAGSGGDTFLALWNEGD